MELNARVDIEYTHTQVDRTNSRARDKQTDWVEGLRAQVAKASASLEAHLHGQTARSAWHCRIPLVQLSERPQDGASARVRLDGESETMLMSIRRVDKGECWFLMLEGTR